MIKNIIFALILCCALFSCGKKGDPVYKVSKKNYLTYTIHFNKS